MTMTEERREVEPDSVEISELEGINDETLEVGTSSATYVFKSEAAKLAAAIAHCASKDSARTSLQTVRIKYDADTLEVMATDSYIVAWREFVTINEGTLSDRLIRRTEGVRHGECIVDAKPLQVALLAAAKTVGNFGMITLELSDDSVIIVAGGSTTELPCNRVDFPGVDSIIKDNRAVTGGIYNGKLPALNPLYLEKIRKATGLTVSQFKLPFVFHVTKKHVGNDTPELCPLVITYGSDFHALLMPVRV